MEGGEQRTLFRDGSADDTRCDTGNVGACNTAYAGVALGRHSEAEQVGDVLPLVGGSPVECGSKTNEACGYGQRGKAEVFKRCDGVAPRCPDNLLPEFYRCRDAITCYQDGCGEDGRDNQGV